MRPIRLFALAVAGVLPAVAALSPLPDLVATRIAYSVERGRSSAILDELSTRPSSAPPSFELVAEAFAPSVVTVDSLVIQAADPFGLSLRKGQGLGSGMILDTEGHVLTNSHVVEEARSLGVRLHDGRRFEAQLVGRDPRTDLAVLKIDAKNLVPARFGDSADVRVGQWVLAFGSPYGLTRSVTHGIVSAVGRADMGIAEYEDFIQTDASINRGNSGGPLVDMSGHVIGINTAIYAPSGGNEGIAFAIPSNMAKSVVERILRDGRVVRGYLGVSMVAIDAEIAQQIGYDGAKGILVDSLTREGPAARAGIRPGDVILSIDGVELTTSKAVQTRIADAKPGTRVLARVWRRGVEQDVPIQVAELPEEVRLRARRR